MEKNKKIKKKIECHHRAKCIKEQTEAAKKGGRENRIAREERVL